MNIVKEKNLVKFHIEGKARPYIIDLNKGIIYGLRGIEIQSIPPAIYKAYIPAEERTSVLNLVREQYIPRHYSALYAFADKLDGIGYHAPAWELRQINRQLDEIDFKKLSKYLRETEDASLDQYMRVYAKELWREQKGLRIDDHFTEQMAEFLYDNFRTQPKEVLSIFAYYLSRGLWDFCNDRWTCHNYLDRYLTYMNCLEWKMEKNDFFRSYINARRAYEINRDKMMNKGINAYQQEHIKALTFEDDTFEVIIPTTNKELRAKASTTAWAVMVMPSSSGERMLCSSAGSPTPPSPISPATFTTMALSISISPPTIADPPMLMLSLSRNCSSPICMQTGASNRP